MKITKYHLADDAHHLNGLD